MDHVENKNNLKEMMETTIGKVNEMANSNTIVGEPITTPDGVTVIPISKLSFGFGYGGGDYGATTERFGAGSAAGVKIDPVAFLVVKDGSVRVMPVAVPAVSTVDRVIEMLPDMIDRVENFVDKKKEKELF